MGRGDFVFCEKYIFFEGVYIMAKETKAATSVADKKLEEFRKYVEDNKITGFNVQDWPAGGHVVRSLLPVADAKLPFGILFDDSVYAIIQIQLGEGLATGEKAKKIYSVLNALNDQYRMLKFSVDVSGNVLLACVVASGLPNFEPALVIAILNSIQEELNAHYADIMEALKK